MKQEARTFPVNIGYALRNQYLYTIWSEITLAPDLYTAELLDASNPQDLLVFCAPDDCNATTLGPACVVWV